MDVHRKKDDGDTVSLRAFPPETLSEVPLLALVAWEDYDLGSVGASRTVCKSNENSV